MVVVEQSLATGVRGKRPKRILRSLEVVPDRHSGSSRVHGDAAGRSSSSVAQWSLSDQSARINGPKRNTGPDGCVDGGVQLRLIVNAVQAQPAGEIDESLFLAKRAQHFCCGLQSGQLTVGVEDVEFGIILAEGRAGVSGAGVVDGVSRVLVF